MATLETIPAYPPATERPVKKRNGCARYFVMLFLAFLIIGGALFYWKYYYTYSDGNRTGLLQKLSHKGNMIKTWEGELVLSSVTTTSNVAIASEKFYFSIASDSLARAMQNMEGQWVRLQYEQKKGALFWRGESEYIVTGATPEQNPQFQQPVQQVVPQTQQPQPAQPLTDPQAVPQTQQQQPVYHNQPPGGQQAPPAQ